MESTNQIVRADRRTEPVIPAGRQLPEPRRGAVGRLVGEAKALVDDTSTLMELRLKRMRLELEAKIEQKANAAATAAAFGIFLALGGLFLLIAASLGLGALLGHPAWGFLIVGAVICLIGVIIRIVRPHLFNVGPGRVTVDASKLADGSVGGRHNGR